MYNWCKHQINHKEHICKSRSRLLLRTRRGPNPEQPFVSVTTMFLPYRSTLLPSSRQAPPSATCACHSPVPPQGYARSGHAHCAAPDRPFLRDVGSGRVLRKLAVGVGRPAQFEVARTFRSISLITIKYISHRSHRSTKQTKQNKT